MPNSKKGESKPLRAPEEKSRALLLDAAKKLFARSGFDGTTVREIATEAGVNLSLVSYYFKGKEGLYLSCVEEFGQARLAAAERLLQPIKGYEELRTRLSIAIEETFRQQFEQPELTAIIQREVDSNLPIARTVFENTFLKSFESWVQFFKDAQDAGIVRKDLDSQILTHTLQGALISFFRMDRLILHYRNLSLVDLNYRKKVIHNLVEVFLKGCTIS